MNALLFLIPISLLMGLTALVACIWSLRSNQNEDPEGAKYRIFGEDFIDDLSAEAKQSGTDSGHTSQKVDTFQKTLSKDGNTVLKSADVSSARYA